MVSADCNTVSGNRTENLGVVVADTIAFGTVLVHSVDGFGRFRRIVSMADDFLGAVGDAVPICTVLVHSVGDLDHYC